MEGRRWDLKVEKGNNEGNIEIAWKEGRRAYECYQLLDLMSLQYRLSLNLLFLPRLLLVVKRLLVLLLLRMLFVVSRGSRKRFVHISPVSPAAGSDVFTMPAVFDPPVPAAAPAGGLTPATEAPAAALFTVTVTCWVIC